MPDMDLEKIMYQARRIVTRAGQIILENFEHPTDIHHKGRIDLVTSTDVAVEEFLKERLGVLLPEADFLAEESASDVKPGRLTWIIDPLDGTTNFAHGFPFVAVSVALWMVNQVALGIVHLPLMNETFHVVRGQGAFLNDRPAKVSDNTELQSALIATGFPYDVKEHVDPILSTLKKVLTGSQGVRRAGSAAIDLAYTACGRMDGFYEVGLKPWDTAAGWLLVEEAGGKVTTFDPPREYQLGSFSIVAANPALHDQLASLLVDTGFEQKPE